MSTVKDFIPIQDARLTIEKEVKPKLTTKELTTIEKPGIPVPALQLIPQKKKARAKIPKPKKEPSSVTQPKADSILIITEKPQAAEKIANAIPLYQWNKKSLSFWKIILFINPRDRIV